MKSAADVITTDLDQLTSQLADEFPKLSGRRVMIAGGAGISRLLSGPGTAVLEQAEPFGRGDTGDGARQLHPR